MFYTAGGVFLYGLVFTYIMLMMVFTRGVFRVSRINVIKPDAGRDRLPFVSVLVAVRNEESNLENLLGGLLQQNYPNGLWEVVISDDQSEDNTLAILSDFMKMNPEFPVKVIAADSQEIREKGKKQALGRALRASSGEVLLCTDADTVLDARWISAMTRQLEDSRVMMVLGPVFIRQEGSFLQKLQETEFFGIMGLTAGSAALGIPVMANGANLCFRREAYIGAGGYLQHQRYASGDDQFLMMSVRKRFGKSAVRFNFDRAASVYTTAEPELKGFFNQRLRWISKSPGYRDEWVLLTGVVAGLTTLAIFAGMVISFTISSGPLSGKVFCLWLAKSLADLPMVLKMRKLAGSRIGLGFYLPAQLFQLVYIPVTGAASLFIRSRWKGRRV